MVFNFRFRFFKNKAENRENRKLKQKIKKIQDAKRKRAILKKHYGYS